MSGRTILDTPEHRPLFLRTARSLERLACSGYSPLADESDYVLWSPREFNIVADHAANASMDSLSTWSALDGPGLADMRSSGSNIRLCVDGGRCDQQTSAIGVALYLCMRGPCGNYQYKVVARKGVWLTNVSSAFLAEALALDCGLQLLLSVLDGTITCSS